jgi:hypothetical protein
MRASSPRLYQAYNYRDVTLLDENCHKRGKRTDQELRVVNAVRKTVGLEGTYDPVIQWYADCRRTRWGNVWADTTIQKTSEIAACRAEELEEKTKSGVPECTRCPGRIQAATRQS